MAEEIRITSTESILPPRDGFLESEDDVLEVRIPSEVMDWSWKIELWDRINAACDTDIDDHEGVWLDSFALKIAAQIIHQTLSDESELSEKIVSSMTEASEMLDVCADRGVRVMFSL
jgi:hypothetical protein